MLSRMIAGIQLREGLWLFLCPRNFLTEMIYNGVFETILLIDISFKFPKRMHNYVVMEVPTVLSTRGHGCTSRLFSVRATFQLQVLY